MNYAMDCTHTPGQTCDVWTISGNYQILTKDNEDFLMLDLAVEGTRDLDVSDMFGIGWVISDDDTRDIAPTEAYFALWSFEFWKWRYTWSYKSLRSDMTLNEVRASPFSAYTKSDKDEIWTQLETKIYNSNKVRILAMRPFKTNSDDSRDLVINETRKWSIGYIDFDTKIARFSIVMDLDLYH